MPQNNDPEVHESDVLRATIPTAIIKAVKAESCLKEVFYILLLLIGVSLVLANGLYNSVRKLVNFIVSKAPKLPQRKPKDKRPFVPLDIKRIK